MSRQRPSRSRRTRVITLPQLLSTAVEADPDGVAVVLADADGTLAELTYAELDERSTRLARLLIARGIGPEDLVAVAFPRSLEAVIALWAVAKSGAGFVLVDPADPPHRIAHLVVDSGAMLGLTVAATRGALPGTTPWLTVDTAEFALELEKFAADPVTYADRLRPLRAEHPAYVVYTIDAIGSPHGVVVTQAGLSVLCEAQRARHRTDGDSRTLAFADPAHDASVLEVLLAVGGAATMVVAAPTVRDERALAALLLREDVTHAYLPPELLASIEPSGLDELRVVICTARSYPPELVDRWTQPIGAGPFGAAVRHFLHGYGAAETTVLTNLGTPHSPAEAGGIGAPNPGITEYVLDERLSPVSDGEAGELYIAGAQLARGYLRRPAQTATHFVANPFLGGPGGAGLSGADSRLFRTGDLVRRSPDGTIEYIGPAIPAVVSGVRHQPGPESGSAAASHPDEGENATAAGISADISAEATAIFGPVVPDDLHGESVAQQRDTTHSAEESPVDATGDPATAVFRPVAMEDLSGESIALPQEIVWGAESVPGGHASPVASDVAERDHSLAVEDSSEGQTPGTGLAERTGDSASIAVESTRHAAEPTATDTAFDVTPDGGRSTVSTGSPGAWESVARQGDTAGDEAVADEVRSEVPGANHPSGVEDYTPGRRTRSRDVRSEVSADSVVRPFVPEYSSGEWKSAVWQPNTERDGVSSDAAESGALGGDDVHGQGNAHLAEAGAVVADAWQGGGRPLADDDSSGGVIGAGGELSPDGDDASTTAAGAANIARSMVDSGITRRPADSPVRASAVGERSPADAPSGAAGSNIARAASIPLTAMPRPAISVEFEDTALPGVPLSAAQERMWRINRRDPETVAHNVCFAVRISGRMRVEALQVAVVDVIERHEMLRTVYPLADGIGYQVVLPLDRVLADLNPEPLDESEIEDWLGEYARIAFDVTAEIPARIGIAQIAADDHVVVVVAHRIAADEASVAPFLRDLAVALLGRRNRARPSWSPLPVQYADYALWQREVLGEVTNPESVAAQEIDHWRNAVAAIADGPELPADRPRPATPSGHGAAYVFSVGSEVHARLLELAETAGGTLFTAVHAAFAVLLGRLSGGGDIVVGASVPGRTVGELNSAIGLFENPLVLRTQLDPTLSFAVLLAAVARDEQTAFDHAELPFGMLTAALGESARAYPSWLRFALKVSEPGRSQVELPGLSATAVEFDTGVAEFDLRLSVFPRRDNGAPGGLSATFTYATDLFDEITVAGFAERLVLLLEAVTADAQRSIGDIELLQPDERMRILGDWNNTRYSVEPGLLLDGYRRAVGEHPDVIAVSSADTELTYAEFDARVNRLARLLIAQGVGPETMVVAAIRPSLDLLVALYGILTAGGAYVPVDPDHPAERIGYILDTVRPVCVVVTGADSVAVRHDTQVLRLDSADSGGFDAGPVRPDELTRPLRPGHPAYVIFTSGSTGRPKGVVVSHAAIDNQLAWMLAAYPLANDDVYLQKTPPTYDASLWGYFLPLRAGARLRLAAAGRSDPLYIAESIIAHSVTVTDFVPSQLAGFADRTAPGICPTLREIFVIGEVLPTRVVTAFQRISDARVHNLYGPTEAAISVTYWPAASVDGSTVPIGLPQWNTRVYVLDDRLRPVPVGVPGELYLAGAPLARGYADRPDLTAERFVADPFSAQEAGGRMYRTGDLVVWREGSGELPARLDYLGRTDFQINIHGRRIEPGEIEAALLAQSSVGDAVVVARDERLVAYVEPRPGMRIVTERVAATLTEVLPEELIPDVVVPMDALPRIGTGKLDRRALPDPSLGVETSSSLKVVRPDSLGAVRPPDALAPTSPQDGIDTSAESGWLSTQWKLGPLSGTESPQANAELPSRSGESRPSGDADESATSSSDRTSEADRSQPRWSPRVVSSEKTDDERSDSQSHAEFGRASRREAGRSLRVVSSDDTATVDADRTESDSPAQGPAGLPSRRVPGWSPRVVSVDDSASADAGRAESDSLPSREAGWSSPGEQGAGGESQNVEDESDSAPRSSGLASLRAGFDRGLRSGAGQSPPQDSSGESAELPDTAEMSAQPWELDPDAEATAPAEAEPVPLSPVQEWIRQLDRAAHRSGASVAPAYHLPFALRLTGSLDVEALGAALNDVVARHEVLRTVYPTAAESDSPEQRVLRTEPLPPLVAQRVSGAGVTGAVRELAAAPFDVTTETPLRARVLEIADLAPGSRREYVLAVVVHRIAADGSALGPFVADLMAAYAARTANHSPRWAPLSAQYADYVRWQRDMLGSESDPESVAAQQIAFWRAELAGLPEVLDLPGAHPRPAVASLAGAWTGIHIDAAAHTALLQLAHTHATTLLTVLQTAVAAFLARLSGSEDIAIGTPLPGRAAGEFEDLIGTFVNVVVLRARPDSAESFSDLLIRQRDTQERAFAHADLPFARLVEVLGIEQSAAYHPLFQVGVAVRNPARTTVDLPGLTVEDIDIEVEVSQFDLNLTVTETYDSDGNPSGIDGRITYATDLFDSDAAQGLAEGLTVLLTALVARPTEPLGVIGVPPTIADTGSSEPGDASFVLGANPGDASVGEFAADDRDSGADLSRSHGSAAVDHRAFADAESPGDLGGGSAAGHEFAGHRAGNDEVGDRFRDTGVVGDTGGSREHAPDRSGDGPTLVSMLEQVAQDRPDAVGIIGPALETGGGATEFSIGALDAQANRMARYLISLGVVRGSIVALAVRRSVDLGVAVYAVAKAGGAALPVDPEGDVERNREILAGAAPVCVLADAEYPFVASNRTGGDGSFDAPTELLTPIGRTPAHRPATGGQPMVVRVDRLDLDGIPAHRLADTERVAPLHTTDPAWIIQSGGADRAVVSHAGAVAQLTGSATGFGLGFEDRELLATAAAFDLSVWEFWSIALGAPVQLGEQAARPRTIPELMASAVAANPDGPAVVFRGRSFTYTQLDRASSKLARRLIELGAGPEKSVAVAIPRSLEALVTLWSVAKTGAAVVPVEPNLAGDRITDLVSDSGAVLGVTVRAVVAGLPRVSAEWLVLDHPSFAAEVDAQAGEPISDAERTTMLLPDDGAYVLYGSADVDQSQGIVVAHEDLADLAEQASHYRLQQDSRVLALAAPSSDEAVLELVLALGAAAALVVAPATIGGGPELARLIRTERVTHAFLPEAALQSVDSASLDGVEVVVTDRAVPAGDYAVSHTDISEPQEISGVAGETMQSGWVAGDPRSAEESWPAEEFESSQRSADIAQHSYADEPEYAGDVADAERTRYSAETGHQVRSGSSERSMTPAERIIAEARASAPPPEEFDSATALSAPLTISQHPRPDADLRTPVALPRRKAQTLEPAAPGDPLPTPARDAFSESDTPAGKAGATDRAASADSLPGSGREVSSDDDTSVRSSLPQRRSRIAEPAADSPLGRGRSVSSDDDTGARSALPQRGSRVADPAASADSLSASARDALPESDTPVPAALPQRRSRVVDAAASGDSLPGHARDASSDGDTTGRSALPQRRSRAAGPAVPGDPVHGPEPDDDISARSALPQRKHRVADPAESQPEPGQEMSPDGDASVQPALPQRRARVADPAASGDSLPGRGREASSDGDVSVRSGLPQRRSRVADPTASGDSLSAPARDASSDGYTVQSGRPQRRSGVADPAASAESLLASGREVSSGGDASAPSGLPQRRSRAAEPAAPAESQPASVRPRPRDSDSSGLTALPQRRAHAAEESTAAVGSTSSVMDDQPAEHDSLPLPPRAVRMLEIDPSGRESRAIALDVPSGVSQENIQVAIRTLVHRHPLLSARLAISGRSAGDPPRPWSPVFAGSAGEARLVPVRPVPEIALRRFVHSDGVANMAVRALAAELDPAHGRNIGFGLVDAPESAEGRDDSQVLVIAANGLVVDDVSWRIIIGELSRAWSGGTLSGAPIAPDAVAHALADRGAEDAVRAEVSWWQRALADLPAETPLDGVDLTARGRVSLVITAEGAAAVNAVAAAYHTEVEDVLLTALALALVPHTRAAEILGPVVQLTADGRSSAGPESAGTVGGFTAAYPLPLILGEVDLDDVVSGGAAAGAAISRVKEQRRTVPAGGAHYGRLRYLDPDAAAPMAALAHGRTAFGYRDLRPARPYPDTPAADLFLDITVDTTAEGFRARFDYASAVLDADDVKELAGHWVRSLGGLAEHGTRSEAGGFTPSDFPLVALAQNDIDQLRYEHPDMADVWPVAPLQAGLLTSREPTAAAQFAVDLRGPLDDRRLRLSAQAVLGRHDGLRVAFGRWTGGPVQVVCDDVDISWRTVDFTDLTTEDARAEVIRYQAADRLVPFDPQYAPLLRFAVLKSASATHRVLLTAHPLLLDDRSLRLVMRDLLTVYARGPRSRRLPAVYPYRGQPTWLAAQNGPAARSIWREALSGYHTPVLLGRADAAGEIASATAEVGVDLRPADAVELSGLATRLGVTVQMVVQAAWGLLLGRFADRDDVVFGVAAPGRSPQVPHAEALVGRFGGIVPVRVRPEPAESLEDLLLRIRAEWADRPGYYCPSQAEMARPLGVDRLFDSVVIFRDDAADLAELSGIIDGVRIEDVDSAPAFADRVALAVVLNGPIRLSLRYPAEAVSESVANVLAYGLAAVIRQIAEAPHTRIADLELPIEHVPSDAGVGR